MKSRKTLAEMIEARENLENEMDELIKEDRDLTDEDSKRIIQLQKEITSMNDDIRAAEEIEKAKQIAAERRRKIDRANRPKDTIEEAPKRFSFLRFIQGCLEGNHEGLEAEVVAEGMREAKRTSHVDSMQNPLPSSFIRANEQDASTTGFGKETIDTDLGGLIPALRPKLKVSQLGARHLNLTRPLDLPRQTEVMKAAWRGEKQAADQTYAKFDNIELRPHGLSAWTSFTRELAFQSDLSVESFVRQELEDAIQRKLDQDFLTGTGLSGQPKGLLKLNGTLDGNVQDPTKITWADIVNFWTKIVTNNADADKMKFYTNPLVADWLMSTPKVDGTDSKMLLDDPRSTLSGYDIVLSNQVPNDIADGDHDNSVMIFANWDDALIAQFAGVDFIVNPYTEAKKAMVEVISHTWWDFGFRHPESFVIAKNIRTGPDVRG